MSYLGRFRILGNVSIHDQGQALTYKIMNFVTYLSNTH